MEHKSVHLTEERPISLLYKYGHSRNMYKYIGPRIRTVKGFGRLKPCPSVMLR